MKRKLEFGCLLILTIAWALFVLWWLFGGSILPAKGASLGDLDSLDCGTFSVVYDPELKIPVAVDWVCAAQYLSKARRERSWRFTEDIRVSAPRACHDDYTNSGFDRGHMVPAADRSLSITSMKSTFIMTNVCPQVPALNRGAWKRLEDGCRNYARQGVPVKVHVDAVFWKADTLRIGRHGVAVPHGFVKSVYSWPSDSLLYARYFQNW